MNDNDNLNDELIRASIPVGVSTVSILGLQLADILYLVTILYTFTQMCCLVYRTVNNNKNKQRKDDEQK
ncbi:MAG: hypothetical protein DBY32_11220 [Phascolarctobacterium sp.]|nr:MAG: hypothetical protein DBY32_11220 [Phascolarctobacterium sp.]